MRHLERAPIVEAIFDVRFALDEEVKLQDFKVPFEKFATALPHVETRGLTQKKITFSDKMIWDLKDENNPEFEICRSNNENFLNSTRSASVQADGITIRHAAPYGKWDDLVDEAHKLFDIYVGVAKPRSVIRIGTRFVNKIKMPARWFDFDEYLIYGPKVPGNVSESIFDFHSRVGVQPSDPNLKGWVNQYLLNEVGIGLSVILDIDVFRTDWHPCEWDVIANPVEEIHMMKNGLFFGSLTEKALGGFE